MLTLLVCEKRVGFTGYTWKPSSSAKSACGWPLLWGAPARESAAGRDASASLKSTPCGRFTNKVHRW